MNVNRRIVLMIGLGALGIVIAALWGMRQSEETASRQVGFERAQWGPSSDYERLCRAELNEDIGQVDPAARVAFWAPRFYRDSANKAMRPVGTRAPLATGKDNLTHVACVSFVRVVAETCAYEGGTSMDRRRYDADVRLIDMKARTVVAKWKTEGRAPAECPATVRRRRSDPNPPPIEGDEPNFLRGLYELDAFKRK